MSSPKLLCGPFIICLLLTMLAKLAHSHHIDVNITVPDFKVDQEDAYVCVAVQLPPKPHKLIGIIPRAQQEVVHHILLYGCVTPHVVPTAFMPSVWRCDQQPICQGGSSSTIMSPDMAQLDGGITRYGWGRNAPDLQLPEGVGFSVGKGTSIQYVVAQVHYLQKRPDSDHSGVTLMLQPHPSPYAAGLLSYAASFSIPPGEKSYKVQNQCCLRSYQPLHAFAFRVHTHMLGRSVSLQRAAANHSGSQQLMQRDPQLPQAFVPTPQPITLWPGDELKVVCDFDSSHQMQSTTVGPTHNHEMCNLYLMVSSPTPYIVMCSDNRINLADDTPGALPRNGRFAAEPSPFWKPPGSGEQKIGDVVSVKTSHDGTVWLASRGDRQWLSDTFDSTYKVTATEPINKDVVVQIDADTGNVLQSWGAGEMYLPHTLTVDRQSNVWVVDTGRHQALKFSPTGTLLLELGTKLVPGKGPQHFCQPTQVAIQADGSIWVADGYCNQRLVKFSADGKYLGEASDKMLQVVHSVLLDECSRMVYAASRENGLVMGFDIRTFKLMVTYKLGELGKVWALQNGPYGELLALIYNSGSGKDAQLVRADFPKEAWTLPGTANLSPHDIALGAASVQLTGPGDRLYALYVAPCGVDCYEKGCGSVRKLVMVPSSFQLPDPSTIEAPAQHSHTHSDESASATNTTAIPDKGVEGKHKGEGIMVVADDDELEQDDDGLNETEDYDEQENQEEQASGDEEAEVHARHHDHMGPEMENDSHDDGDGKEVKFDELIEDQDVIEKEQQLYWRPQVLALILMVLVGSAVMCAVYAKAFLRKYTGEEERDFDSGSAGGIVYSPDKGSTIIAQNQQASSSSIHRVLQSILRRLGLGQQGPRALMASRRAGGAHAVVGAKSELQMKTLEDMLKESEALDNLSERDALLQPGSYYQVYRHAVGRKAGEPEV